MPELFEKIPQFKQRCSAHADAHGLDAHGLDTIFYAAFLQWIQEAGNSKFDNSSLSDNDNIASEYYI
ncbi:MAG: hypothetical protein ACKVE4_07860 [Dissulfuribacterales bacterium]